MSWGTNLVYLSLEGFFYDHTAIKEILDVTENMGAPIEDFIISYRIQPSMWPAAVGSAGRCLRGLVGIYGTRHPYHRIEQTLLISILPCFFKTKGVPV